MRILHTSDWHLGKTLEGVSRMDEQEKFINDFVKIVEDKNIDLVIISGDIYDNSNPPARAEKMFYKALKKITCNGKRLLLAIAGNHDNPDRLVAASPLAYEQGVILLGRPKSCAQVGKCGNYNVVDSKEGVLELEIKGEKAVIITLPYPSEKRLNEILYDKIEDDERQKNYNARMEELLGILCKNYREDTINLLVSHIFILGGEESDSERNIQLGGSLAVSGKIIPKNAQYVALGHLHKPQKVSSKTNCFYSGSPLQYSKSEKDYAKSCYVIEIHPSKEPIIERVYFKNYKPIEVWKCNSVSEAIEKCKENSGREVWVYLEIKTDKYITQEDIKTMKGLKKDILEIRPRIEENNNYDKEFYDVKKKSMKELFEDFYIKKRMVEPTSEITELFLSIAKEEEGEEE